MKRWTLVPVFVLVAALSGATPSHASTPRWNLGGIFKALGSTVTVPPEWDGIWATEDSTYDCTNGLDLTGTSSDADTICGGQAVGESGPSPVTCDGTATATTVDVTCTGSFDVFPDCQASLVIHIQVTRTADSYRSVTTVNESYTGTGEGCDFLQDRCTRTVSYGTRTDPAPPAYCLTEVRRTTWGRLKSIYR